MINAENIDHVTKSLLCSFLKKVFFLFFSSGMNTLRLGLNSDFVSILTSLAAFTVMDHGYLE